LNKIEGGWRGKLEQEKEGIHCDGCGSYIKQQGYEKIKNQNLLLLLLILNLFLNLKKYLI